MQRASTKLGFDVEYFLKGSFWTSIPTFAELGMNTLLAVALAALIPQAEYGEYQFFLSMLFLLGLFSLTGNTGAVIPSVSRGHDRSLVDATRQAIRWGWLGGSVVALILATYFWYWGDPEMAPYLLLTALFIPFVFSFKSYTSFLIGKERFAQNAHLWTAQIVIVNLCLLAIAYLTRDVFILAAAYLILWSASSALCYAYVKRKYASSIAQSKPDPELHKASLHFTGLQIPPVIGAHIDKILVGLFLGLHTLAIYAVAQNIAQINQLVLKPALRIVLPKLAKQKKPKLTFEAMQNKLVLMLIFSAVICLLNILVSPILIRLLFPAAYIPAITLTQMLVLAYVVNFATILFQNFLVAHRFTRALHTVSWLTVGSKAILLALLLPHFGVWGAVFAFVGAAVIEFLLSWQLSAHAVRSPAAV